MPKEVNFDGLGIITFPDEMADEEIQKTLDERAPEYRRTLIASRMDQVINEPTEQRSTYDKAVNSFVSGAASGVADVVSRAAETALSPPAKGTLPSSYNDIYEAFRGAGMAEKFPEWRDRAGSARGKVPFNIDEKALEYSRLAADWSEAPANVKKTWEIMVAENQAKRQSVQTAVKEELGGLSELSQNTEKIAQSTPGNEFVANVAQGAGSIVAPILASTIPGAGTAVSAMQSGGSTKREAQEIYDKWGIPSADSDKLSDEDANAAETSTFAFTAGTHRVLTGLGNVAGKVPSKYLRLKKIGDAAKGFLTGAEGVEATFSRLGANPEEAKTLGNFAYHLVKEGFGEFVEEAGDQLVQGAWAMRRYRPDLTWEDAVKEAWMAGTIGFLLGAGTEGVRMGVDKAMSVGKDGRPAPDPLQSTKIAIEARLRAQKAADDAAKAGAPAVAAATADAAQKVDITLRNPNTGAAADVLPNSPAAQIQEVLFGKGFKPEPGINEEPAAATVAKPAEAAPASAPTVAPAAAETPATPSPAEAVPPAAEPTPVAKDEKKAAVDAPGIDTLIKQQKNLATEEEARSHFQDNAEATAPKDRPYSKLDVEARRLSEGDTFQIAKEPYVVSKVEKDQSGNTVTVSIQAGTKANPKGGSIIQIKPSDEAGQFKTLFIDNNGTSKINEIDGSNDITANTINAAKVDGDHRLITSHQDVVDALHEAIAEVNSQFGGIVQRIHVVTMPHGSGLHSPAPSARFNTIVVDPARLKRSMGRGVFSLKAAVTEEAIHNLDGLAIHKMWESMGKPGSWSDFMSHVHSEIYDEMTPAERSEVFRRYGAPMDEQAVAAEFLRMLVQQRDTGRITESNYVRPAGSMISRILNWLKKFWTSISGQVVASKAARDHIARITKLAGGTPDSNNFENVQPAAGDSLRKMISAAEPASNDPNQDFENITQKSNGNENAANPGTVSVQGRKRGSARGSSESVSKASADSSGDNSSSGESTGGSETEGADSKGEATLGQDPVHRDVELPTDWHRSAYEKINEKIDKSGFWSETNKDLARTYIGERFFNQARAWFVDHNGTMQGFSVDRAFRNLSGEFGKYIGAKKRGSGEASLSLDDIISDVSDEEMSKHEATQDTITDSERKQTAFTQKFGEHYDRIAKTLPQGARELLSLELNGERGWKTEYASKLGVTPASITGYVDVAKRLLARGISRDEEARLFFMRALENPKVMPEQMQKFNLTFDDVMNAAPVDPNDEATPVTAAGWNRKAIDLTSWQKLARINPFKDWSAPGYLRDVASRTPDPTSRRLLENLADGIQLYFDSRKAITGRQMAPWFEILNGNWTNKEIEQAKTDAQDWISTAQARNNGITADAAWNAAQAKFLQYSELGKRMIELVKEQGVQRGAIMASVGVMVQDGARYRPFNNLGERYWPRMMSRATQDILSDPDSDANHPEYARLINELMAHNATQFRNFDEADRYFQDHVASSMASGDFYAGVDFARGIKLPDSWYDYSVDTLIAQTESWANRIAQIHAFGQFYKVGSRVNHDAWTQAQQLATRQDELSETLQLMSDSVMGRNQKKWGWFMNSATVGIATTRYLTSFMTSVRNAESAVISTAENLGYWKAFRAATVSLRDVAYAASRSLYHRRMIEPRFIEQGMAAGSIQRGLYFNRMYGLDLRKQELGSKFSHWLLTPNNLVEQWTRGVNTIAAIHWVRVAQDNITRNPNSYKSRTMRAQLERWGFDNQQQAALFAGNRAQVNRFLRAAVTEKQYGYALDQVPLLFQTPGANVMLQFQRWGAQRQRDLTRNVLRPLFGEQLDGKRVVNPAPFLRFLLSNAVGVAAVRGLAQFLFGRKQKDPTWEEVWNASSDDEKIAMKMAVQHVLNDITATGASGIIGDHLRTLKDSLTQGRDKSISTPPGLQIIQDISNLVRSQAERGGDPSAFWRDFKETLLRPTPAIRETEDFSLKWLFDQSSAGKYRAAREDVSVSRALLRRWNEETGRDENSQRKGSVGMKGPNTETFDQLNEALMVGDYEAAGNLVNEFTSNRTDGKKLRQIKASVRGRAPLAGQGKLTAPELAEFESWVSKRNPEALSNLRDVNTRYERTARIVGLLQ